MELTILNNKTALLVVDMLNDFLTGSLACEKAKMIIKPVEQLIAAARKKGVPIIYCNDAHDKGVDKELELWGDHAIAGTKGAEVISELAPLSDDYVVPKHCYSGFFQTDLRQILTKLGIEKLIVAGIYTHICVLHTIVDAYYWGYDIYVPEDCVSAPTQREHEQGLENFKHLYHVQICHSKDLS